MLVTQNTQNTLLTQNTQVTENTQLTQNTQIAQIIPNSQRRKRKVKDNYLENSATSNLCDLAVYLLVI